jgi:hypothetical protein
MNTQLCRCTCLPGFSGDDCGTGSKCLHSGTLVGGSDTDHTVGTCTCTNQWQGDTCNQCALMCHNGASENAAECKCNCPANRKQPTCQQCQDPGCKNGGIFQDLVSRRTSYHSSSISECLRLSRVLTSLLIVGQIERRRSVRLQLSSKKGLEGGEVRAM